jgi:hypothetical protein
MNDACTSMVARLWTALLCRAALHEAVLQRSDAFLVDAAEKLLQLWQVRLVQPNGESPVGDHVIVRLPHAVLWVGVRDGSPGCFWPPGISQPARQQHCAFH